MNFKIDLQYEDISERNYVKTLFEIFDENYAYFSNRVIIHENIFVILLRMLKNKICYLIPDDIV